MAVLLPPFASFCLLLPPFASFCLLVPPHPNPLLLSPMKSLFLVMTVLAIVSPDNSCSLNNNAFGYSCPFQLPCCSQYGWCGAKGDVNYCGLGNQANFNFVPTTTTTTGTGPPIPQPTNAGLSPDFTCGKFITTNPGYICTFNAPCCSQFGWCGSSEAYCLNGQSAFDYVASNPSNPSTTTTTTTTTTITTTPTSVSGAANPTATFAVSTNGRCGISENRGLGAQCPIASPCCSGDTNR